jgi:hypothetical protein
VLAAVARQVHEHGINAGFDDIKVRAASEPAKSGKERARA